MTYKFDHIKLTTIDRLQYDVYVDVIPRGLVMNFQKEKVGMSNDMLDVVNNIVATLRIRRLVNGALI